MNHDHLYRIEMEAAYTTARAELGARNYALLTGWRWRRRSTQNGQIVGTSHEAYTKRSHCIEMIQQGFLGAINVSPWVKIIKKGKVVGRFDRTAPERRVVIHPMPQEKQ